MSGDTTIQALKRLTWLPERDTAHNGDLIAGQNYFDVYFAGGTITNVLLSNVTINNPIFGATISVSNGGTGATSLTGILKGNGTAPFTAATPGVNYSAGTSALGTGILKSTTATGALTIAVAGDFPTLNQSTSGNAATATALQTGRTINGTTFDGTANITVVAAAGTLTGTVLNATVLTSSLTAVGTIGTGVWNGTVIAGQYGGTGVANTGKTITLGGNLTLSGAFTTTFNVTASTSVTLPTTGTLATLAGTETLTNKTVNGVVLTAAGSSGLYLNQAGSYTAAGSVAGDGCQVSNSSNQTLSAATWTTLTFDTEAYDDSNYHSTSTNTSRLTVPAAGRYIVNGVIELTQNSNNPYGVRIIQNGVTTGLIPTTGIYGNTPYGPDGNIQIAISWVFNMALNDYVELQGYEASSIAAIAAKTSFQIARLK